MGDTFLIVSHFIVVVDCSNYISLIGIHGYGVEIAVKGYLSTLGGVMPVNIN